MKITNWMGFVCGVVLLQGQAQAADSFPARARLFASATRVSVPELNTLLYSAGFDSASVLPSVGVEITHPFKSWFEAGLRYNLRFLTRGVQGLNVNESTPIGALRQDSIQAVARVSFLRTSFLRADVVGGIGGNNTRFEFKNTAQDGKLSRANLSDFVATPMASVGASVGIGAKNFFFTTEVGYEYNKVSDLVKTGAISTSMTSLNLSGPYLIVGAMFDGITATK